MGVSYDQRAGRYDLLDRIYFRNEARSPRHATLGLLPRGEIKLLDMCCGTGENLALIAMHRQDARLTGIDLSEAMLGIARSQLSGGHATLLRMDATRTSFDDGAFDVVLLSLVLHELSADTANAMLTEAKRVLKPDGWLIVIEWEAPKSLLQRLRFLLIRASEPRGFAQFLRMDVQGYFARYGFSIQAEIHCDYSRVLALTASRAP